MQADFQVHKTQAAWRDFAIGLALFLVSLRITQSTYPLGPLAFFAIHGLLAVAIVLGHVALYRLGRFTEVTGVVLSTGRVSVLRLAIVGLAVLILMFSVWWIAQTRWLGGPIARPLPWGSLTLESDGASVGLVLALWFYGVVTTPLIEEVCFRGWIQRGLGHRFNPVITIVTPAALFAVLHASVYSHPAYLLIPLALGLALGLVTERTRSLWPAVVLHALWNLTMVAIAELNADSPLAWQAPENALEVVIALAVMGLSGLLVLRVLPRAESPARGEAPATVVEDLGAAA